MSAEYIMAGGNEQVILCDRNPEKWISLLKGWMLEQGITIVKAEQTAFSIINQYVRFVDEEPDKRKSDWKLNDRWAWFIGDKRQSLKLTTKPEPYTLSRTLNWIARQVAPTLKMLKQIDAGDQTEYLKTIEQQAKLTDKHKQIVKQQTASVDELIEQEKE